MATHGQDERPDGGESERRRIGGERNDVIESGDRFGVSRRSVLATAGAGSLASLLAGMDTAAAESNALHAKTRPTIWTEEMRENALDNVETYDWAVSQRDEAVATADAYLEQFDLEQLWRMVTSQKIPRSGGHPWFRDLLGWDWGDVGFDRGLERPWKMETAEEGYVVPTNDFAAYRESGLDDRGMFDPELADDQYLVNEEHPEMGEGWGVDDGYGWIDEDGDLGDESERLNFVAYYNHWYVWRPGGVMRIIEAMTDAYLLTGDQRYSRAGTVLLDRVADIYPEMDLYEYTETLHGFWNSTGGRQTGKIVGSTWEPNLIRPIIRAYDAFFPGMDEDDELIEFLNAQTEEFPGLDDKDSVEEIRANIEDGILREILPMAENSDIVLESGGYSALVQSARVLDEPDGYTEEALEWIFQPGEELFVGDQWDEEPENWITTGGNILAPLVDVVDRDGYFNRGSPMYNGIRQTSIRQTADHLLGYDGFEGADLYEHPKFRQTLRQNSQLILLDRYIPEIGNTHTDRGLDFLSTESIERGYEATGQDVYAQLWHFVNGFSTEGIRGDIFDENPEELADEIQAVIDAEGPLDLSSQHVPGYGFAALRDGVNHEALERTDGADGDDDLGNEKRAFWLYYGRNDIAYHNHSDALNVGVYAHDLDLSPDLGYVESTGDWPKGHNWTMNTVSHNTVVVGEAEQGVQWVGVPRHFDGDDDRVNLVDVEAPHVYEETEEYRRTLATITVDEEHSYAVDFFRVDGGDDHRYGFHGAKGDASAEGVTLDPQESGTYAGEDVHKPDYGEDTEYNQEVGNGFNYLTNVERDDDPDETVAIDWDVEDHWNNRDDDEGVHLRLTTFGEFDEVALADGHPPDINENPESYRYALLRRTGTDLESTFVSMIEHYEGDRVVESVETVDVTGGEGHAVRVNLVTGRTDYVVCSFADGGTVTVDGTFEFEGFFGVYSVENDEPEYAYVHDGTVLDPVDGPTLVREPAGEVRGFVEDFTRGMSLENELSIRVAGNRDPLERHAGFVYVDNDDSNLWRGQPDPEEPIDLEPRGRGNGAYPIERLESGRGNVVVVGTGERTFARQFTDPDELEDGGYEYVIDEDDDVRIPLTTTWSRES